MQTQTAPQRSLILGGVKSGKSRHAEELAQAYSNKHGALVTLIATATANDVEMHARIARHKASRDPKWRVIEEPTALGAVLESIDAQKNASQIRHCIVVDCLTLWMTNLLTSGDENLLERESAAFLAATRECSSELIIVSNETNMGITPMGVLSRRFCDEIGVLHQTLGKEFDRVSLIVAGLAMKVQ